MTEVQYLARICWNSGGWIGPTREAQALETTSFAAEKGFGFEEWLLNFSWLVDGFHYAFLQPVQKSLNGLRGGSISVLLWTIDPEKRRLLIGRIDNCQVLTEKQALHAHAEHQSRGWLESMQEDLNRLGIKNRHLDSESPFNVRFRPESFIPYGPIYPVANPTDQVAKQRRYELVVANEQTVKENERRRPGSTSLGVPRPHSRSASWTIAVDARHAQLQNSLMSLLQKRFGKAQVYRERDWVDITVELGDKRLLIELKPYPSARQAVREAIGQLLEYAYLRPDESGIAMELFIVAPALADKRVSEYLRLLRTRFKMPLHYCHFHIGGPLPRELMDKV